MMKDKNANMYYICAFFSWLDILFAYTNVWKTDRRNAPSLIKNNRGRCESSAAVILRSSADMAH